MGKQLEFEEVQTAPEAAAAPEVTPAPEPAPEPERKETRGRKKGGKNQPKEPLKQDSEFSFFDEAKKAASEKKASDTPAPEAVNIQPIVEQPALVTGYMLLIVCDAFIPAIIGKFIAKKTGKKAALKKLDKDQLKELQPLADAAAKKMFSGVSEVPAFFIAYGCIALTNNMPE